MPFSPVSVDIPEPILIDSSNLLNIPSSIPHYGPAHTLLKSVGRIDSHVARRFRHAEREKT